MFRRLWNDRNGVTMIMTALTAVVVIGFTGLASDVALWELNARKIQTAADEAALAGAVAIANQANVTSAATSVAGNFGYVDGQSGVTVSVDQDYHNMKEVEVSISALQPQLFTRLFLAAPKVTRLAVAQPPNTPGKSPMCVLALDRAGPLGVGAVGASGTTTANLVNCNLYDDSEAAVAMGLSGEAAVSASKIFLSGGYQVGSNATMSPNPATVTYAAPTPDPYAGLAIPSYSGCDRTNFTASSGNVLTISPGVYCGGITVNGGATLNLDPGIYILDGGNFSVAGNGTVIGAGVTIILTSSTGSNYGVVDLAGGSIVSLTAPSSNTSAGIPGIAIWVDNNAPIATETFNGGVTQGINGVIYMPSQALTYGGGALTTNICTQLVAYDINFVGNTVLGTSGCGPADIPVQSPPAPPRLVL
jgi:Putative Flp pilus-assembly TadE/G-like